MWELKEKKNYQVLPLLKGRLSGYFGTNKKSGPNRENPLNSSLDITDYLLILIYIYIYIEREREREREREN